MVYCLWLLLDYQRSYVSFIITINTTKSAKLRRLSHKNLKINAKTQAQKCVHDNLGLLYGSGSEQLGISPFCMSSRSYQNIFIGLYLGPVYVTFCMSFCVFLFDSILFMQPQITTTIFPRHLCDCKCLLTVTPQPHPLTRCFRPLSQSPVIHPCYLLCLFKNRKHSTYIYIKVKQVPCLGASCLCLPEDLLLNLHCMLFENATLKSLTID